MPGVSQNYSYESGWDNGVGPEGTNAADAVAADETVQNILREFSLMLLTPDSFF